MIEGGRKKGQSLRNCSAFGARKQGGSGREMVQGLLGTKGLRWGESPRSPESPESEKEKIYPEHADTEKNNSAVTRRVCYAIASSKGDGTAVGVAYSI
jgi:hypothetical protein